MTAAQKDAPGSASAALGRHFARLVPTGPQAWSFTLAHHDSWSGAVWQTESGWLCLRAKPGKLMAPNGEDRWSWLQWNSVFPGGVKILLDEMAEVLIGCEVPVGPNLDAAVDNMMRGVLMAVAALEDKRPSPMPARAGGETDSAAFERVAQLCAEAGWACTARSNGTQLAVTMDAPGDFCQAAVAIHDGQVVFSVALLALDPSPPSNACLDAVSGLLLSVTAGMPLVRAVASPCDAMSLGAEAIVAEPIVHESLHQALCALSVLCQHTRKEVRALYEDPAVAEAYLACQQRTPGRRIVHLTAA